MSEWRQISTRNDFSGATVYERADGQAYQVVFPNLEPRTRRHDTIFAAGLIVIAAWWALLFAGYLPELVKHTAVFVVFGSFIWIVGGGIWLSRPWKTVRTLEFDYDAWRFRVLRGGEVTYERPVDALKNLSVDDHPDLEVERHERRQKNEKGPGRLEKRHCLIGWFGPEGTERVELVYRVEWPKRYSLQEVAGAVNWTMKRAAGGAAPEAKSSEAKAAAARGGINPPLD